MILDVDICFFLPSEIEEDKTLELIAVWYIF